MTYTLLQQYWWFIVSLLGAILVFLLFVQGINAQLFCIGKTEEQRRMLVCSTGRKWEVTFTTLVTFGGAFFASFPLFYSTSFGGAYWLWMLILFTFVLQAVSYEFQEKMGNILGVRTYQTFLVVNGLVAPILLGAAVATFFNGSNFIVEKDNLIGLASPTISHWANASHGLDAFLDVWNIVLGLAVSFLSQLLGNLYIINSIGEDDIRETSRRKMRWNFILFLLFFLAFLGHLLTKDGYAVDATTGIIVMEEYKYLHNLVEMWPVAVLFLAGVVMVLAGAVLSWMRPSYTKGIWPCGIGTVITVLALLLLAGYNDTAFYPSTADLQSSLTLSNSCSSEFTLMTMAVVSVLIPFVLAYIVYAWRKIDATKLTRREVEEGE